MRSLPGRLTAVAGTLVIVMAGTGAPALAAAPARARTRIILGRWPGRAGPRAAARYYGYPYRNPPACTDGGRCVADQWLFYRGQCTSWVAYQLNARDRVAFSNSFGGRGRWGNAVHWRAQARKVGITVNGTPSAGAVAWYASTRPAPDGHVAFVARVRSPSSIVMSEMNYDADNGFWVHAITRTGGDWPTAFLHFRRR
jgi:surface antigen